MDTVFFDFPIDEATRRQRLYRGELFVFSPRPSTIALIEFARKMIEDGFGSKNPLSAQ